jgi:hypothetical protein
MQVNKMKVFIVSVLAVTTLSAISGVAYSQTSPSPANGDPQMSPAATMSQPAVTQQPSMERYDYDATGPQPGGSSGSGRGRNGAKCIVGLSCDIYQGS